MWELEIIICGIRAICHDGGHSVWLDHGFAKLDVPSGLPPRIHHRHVYAEVPNLGGPERCPMYYGQH